MKHRWLTGTDHEGKTGQKRNTLYPETLKKKEPLGKNKRK
jgi:hypothetical protein